MQPKSDAQLLCEYAGQGAENSFAELVQRHTDLVYSAALRQVESPAVAAEIAQNVFVALARGAAALAPRLAAEASLAGWLCRSARNLSLNHRRDEFRRTTRERLAMEQFISTPDDAPDWERLRPVLDDAMSELSEADYDALVLRFYNNQDLRSVGAALGVSEDTAQKRVARALEKLREHLSRRNVTAASAALAVVLSANAVHAAPAGLVAMISTATATVVAGAAVQTSTAIAATKTIAMTTLQKTLIATVLVAAVAGGIYEAHEASIARSETQTLRQQQAALTRQVEQLQHERDEASSRLALVKAEIAAAKPVSNSNELLKLRGQVGSLRQQLNSSEANSSAPGVAKMMNDPAMKELIHQTQVSMIRSRYAPLFQELKFTPEQTEKFVQLMGDRYLKSTEGFAAMTQGKLSLAEYNQASEDGRNELGKALDPILGEAGRERWKSFQQEIPARATIDLLNGQLGGNQLNEDQTALLLKLVKAEPFELTHGIAGDFDKAFMGSPEQIEEYLQKIRDSNARVAEQAAGFLTPEQVTGLNTVLSNGVTARLTQAAALVQNH
jgi:RNA polymerase sigma factor (sigma-70 family)